MHSIHRQNVLSLAAVCLMGVTRTAGAQVVVEQNTTISNRLYTDVRVVEGANPDPPTVLQIIDPGYVERTVYLHDSSVLRLTGGEIHDSLYALDQSVARVTGGTIGDTVHSENASAIDVSGGMLLDYVYSQDAGRVNISGGSLWGAIARGDSSISITGGAFRATPQEVTFQAEDSGTIVIHGTGFNYPYGRIADPSGTVTGFLADGERLTADFRTFDGGAVILVPEPNSLAAASGLCVSIVLLASRRRRANRRKGQMPI